jgi:hypothetical protein
MKTVRIALLFLFLLISPTLQAAIPQTITIGGQTINLEDVIRNVDDARKEGQKHFKAQSTSFAKDIERAEAELIKLAQDLDARRITERVYQIRVEQCNRRIQKAQQQIDALEKHANDVGNMITKVVSQGADVFMQSLREDATRKTQIATAAASAAAGQDVKNRGQLEMARFLTSSENLTRTGLMLAGTSFGVFSAWHGLKFAHSYLERYVGEPTLARKRSTPGLLQAIYNLFQPKKDPANLFKGAFFNPETEGIIGELAQSFKDCKAANVPMRHALFYGVPGVGKSMIAEKIAATCGLHAIIFSASDLMQFNPEKRAKVIRELFESIKTPTLIFVDEAEVFFGNNPIDPVAFKEWLSYTGTNSENFTCIYGANGVLHPTIISRTDKIMQIKLPGLEERAKMIRYYLDAFFVEKPLILGGKQATVSPALTPESIRAIAEQLEGRSGRDIVKLVIELPYILMNKQTSVVTPEIIQIAITEKQKQRAEFLAYDGDKAMHEAMDGACVAAPAA